MLPSFRCFVSLPRLRRILQPVLSPPATWTLLLPVAAPSRGLFWEASRSSRGVPEFPELMPRGFGHLLHPSLPFLGGTVCTKRLFSLLQFSPSFPGFVVTSNLRDLQILAGHQAELWQERGRVLFLTRSRPGGGLPQGKWCCPTAFLPCLYPGSRTT